MVKLEELRAATDFLVASGELVSIGLIVRAADGSPLGADRLAALKSGLGDRLLAAAHRQFKDVQNGSVELGATGGTMTVRLYAYGRLNLAKSNGSTAGGHFEAKALALVKSLVEELEGLGGDRPVHVTACWRPGGSLELGDTDPVISTDTAAIDRRVHRIETRRQRLKKYSAAAILVAAVSGMGGGFAFVSADFAKFALLILLYSGGLLAYGVWARMESSSLFKDIEAIRGQQDLEQMLAGEELERRAMKLFQVHSQQLKRYYDQALRQRGLIFFTGIFCIVAGFAVIAVAFVLLRSATPAGSLEKILVASLGAIGGILGNFIAVVYLRMFTETVQSIGTFHDRLVATHHLHFANFLVSKVTNDDSRDVAFRLLAEIAANQDRDGAAPDRERQPAMPAR
jgi:hypothetical protein